MSTEELLIGFYFLIVGLIVGSFLNVVIFRLPVYLNAIWKENCEEFLQDLKSENSGAGETQDKTDDEAKTKKATFNIAYPPSHCPKCKTPIKIWQNIPIVSFILLKGKCSHCQAKISFRYPIIELVTGLLTLFVYTQFGLTYQTAVALLFTWSLIALTMIDLDHLILPDNITLPLMWLGLLANCFGLFTDLKSAVIGAAAGYLTLFSVYWGFKLLTKKEGMGYGDFKLLAALGAFAGWQMLPIIVILSSLCGTIIGGTGMLLFKNSRDKHIPFGPYLAIAGWIAFFYGDALLEAYLAFLSPG